VRRIPVSVTGSLVVFLSRVASVLYRLPWGVETQSGADQAEPGTEPGHRFALNW
jgi:hypothetical protein